MHDICLSPSYPTFVDDSLADYSDELVKVSACMYVLLSLNVDLRYFVTYKAALQQQNLHRCGNYASSLDNEDLANLGALGLSSWKSTGTR